jgi:hypothetical protein
MLFAFPYLNETGNEEKEKGQSVDSTVGTGSDTPQLKREQMQVQSRCRCRSRRSSGSAERVGFFFPFFPQEQQQQVTGARTTTWSQVRRQAL